MKKWRLLPGKGEARQPQAIEACEIILMPLGNAVRLLDQTVARLKRKPGW